MPSTAINPDQQPAPAMTVRRMHFPFEVLKRRNFFQSNTLLSAFGAALSGTFPPGEAEFIQSVRLYRDQIQDPDLQQQIKAFIGQEGHHSHQHKRVNRVLEQLGWDAPAVEASLARSVEKRNRRRFFGSAKFRLALTVGMEHLTAIMAEFMLTKPEVFDGLEPQVKDLLLWHAVEEIEHKAVAFDVYMQCEGDQVFLRKIMRLGTTLFVAHISYFILMLLLKGKARPSWKEIKQAAEFFFGKAGMVTMIKKPYKDYFEPGFHPWDHDNRELVELWKQRFYRAEYDLSQT